MHNVRKIWENSNIRALYPSLYEKARFDEPLKEHTSFKIGGTADLWIAPSRSEELITLVNFSKEHELHLSIFGGGSNLVVSDAGIRDIVVSLEGLKSIENIDPTQVRVGAGVLMDELSLWCKDHGLSGLESFAGLPGSVGGAVFMNARCYDRSISDVFIRANSLLLNEGGCILKTIEFNEEQWAYKMSPFQINRKPCSLEVDEGSLIVLSVDVRVEQGVKEDIALKMEHFVEDRRQKGHFSYPSGGSAFKNNRNFGKPTGKIIDELGLKGESVGDAQVAPWHGNFIINRGEATAMDVFLLVKKIQKTVLQKTGFAIEPEIVFVGNEFKI